MNTQTETIKKNELTKAQSWGILIFIIIAGWLILKAAKHVEMM